MTSLRSGAASDVGRVRRNNQDRYLVENLLFAVADGMGGAAGGEEASLTAVAALKVAFAANPTSDGLADGLRNANRAVWEWIGSDPDGRAFMAGKKDPWGTHVNTFYKNLDLDRMDFPQRGDM